MYNTEHSMLRFNESYRISTLRTKVAKKLYFISRALPFKVPVSASYQFCDSYRAVKNCLKRIICLQTFIERVIHSMSCNMPGFAPLHSALRFLKRLVSIIIIIILLLIARKLTLEYDQMRVTSRIPKNYKKNVIRKTIYSTVSSCEELLRTYHLFAHVYRTRNTLVCLVLCMGLLMFRSWYSVFGMAIEIQCRITASGVRVFLLKSTNI